MREVESPDIYLELLQDLIGDEYHINPNTPILQSCSKVLNVDSSAKKIDDALKLSRDAFHDKLKTDNMSIGCAFGYVEPCPIEYTGTITTGEIEDRKKFHAVFLGLNPHLEPPRLFPEGTTFADLANYHHPGDIKNIKKGCSEEDYKERFSPKGDFQNNYWRVLGHMEYGDSWSPFYKDVVRLYLSLLPSNVNDVGPYNKWKNVTETWGDNLDEFTHLIINKLEEYPIANVELIPYKSTTINLSKFNQLLTYDRYWKYLRRIMKFIDDYTADDGYIIATASVAGKGNGMLDTLYNIFKGYMIYGGDVSRKCLEDDKINVFRENDSFVYNKNNRKIMPGKEKEKAKKKRVTGEKEDYVLAPMYLIRWKDRKVILTSPISGNNNYGWIYRDLSNGWIDEIKKHFNQGE